MDSTMMYLHVKKIGNESVDPVKNLHGSHSSENEINTTCSAYYLEG